MILEDIQKEIYFEDSEILSKGYDQKNSIPNAPNESFNISRLDDSVSGFLNKSRLQTVRWIKSNSPYMKKFGFGNFFIQMINLVKQSPDIHLLIFEYLKLTLLHLKKLDFCSRVEKEYAAWTKLLIKRGEILMDIDRQKMTEIVKLLSPKMIYQYILNLSLIHI